MLVVVSVLLAARALVRSRAVLHLETLGAIAARHRRRPGGRFWRTTWIRSQLLTSVGPDGHVPAAVCARHPRALASPRRARRGHRSPDLGVDGVTASQRLSPRPSTG